MTPREPIVVFDIETVPDMDLHTGEDFPKLPFHKVVAISYLRARSVDGPDGRHFEVDVLKSGGGLASTERDLVYGFLQFIEKSKPRLVTFNGRGFDLPVLKYRALKYGLSAPWFSQGESKWENYGHRYSVDWHCDVMDALSDFGAAKSAQLGEICALLGIPSKLGIDGSQVKGYIDAGRLAEVRDYCETDVIATFAVFLRYALFRGELSTDGHRTSIECLKTCLANSGERQHLSQFLETWAI